MMQDMAMVDGELARDMRKLAALGWGNVDLDEDLASLTERIFSHTLIHYVHKLQLLRRHLL